MKKFGTLLLSFVPLILGIVIQFAAVFLVMIVSAIFMYGIAPAISGETYTYYDLMMLWSDMDFNTMASIIFSVSCAVIFGLWYYKSCGGNFLPKIKTTFQPLEFVGIALLVPGTQFLSSIVVSIVSVIFPSWLEAYEELLESAGLSTEISIMMMIYSVLLAPISEELIFRGVALRIARRAFPFWFANILQAVCFGIFHMNMLQGVYTFVVGLILGYICEKTGSIYHAMFFHLLFNLWGTTASEWLIVDDPMLQVAIIFLGTILGLTFGFILLNKGIQKKEAVALQT